MNRLTLVSGLVILASAAIAGPFDLLKSASSSSTGSAGVARYVEPAAKGVDALTVDTPQGRQRVGQAVAVAATAKYSGLDDRDSLQAYVTFVGLTVARAADPKESHGHFCFAVLNSPDPTACSGPGGYVMITRGALEMMSDESELAGVLAHEIAHVCKNHGIESLRTSKLTDAAVSAASASDKHVATFNNLSDNLVANILEKGYSRSQEADADKLAIQYVSRAGYDPMGYARFLKKLQAVKDSGGGAFSTHPSTKDRIKTVEKLCKPGGVTLADRFQRDVHE